MQTCAQRKKRSWEAAWVARQLSGQGRLMGMKVMYRHADNTTTLGKARGFQLVGPEAMRQQEAFLQGEAQLDVNLGS